MSEIVMSNVRAGEAAAAAPVPGITPPSRLDRQGVFLTDVIVELGFADAAAVQGAIDAARQSARTTERCLLDNGVVDEHQLSLALAERNGLDHIDLELFDVDPEAVSLIDRSTAARYTALPVAFAPDGALIVAFENPYDMLGISDIEVMAKSEVRPVVAAGTQIQRLIEGLPERRPIQLSQSPEDSSASGSTPEPTPEPEPEADVAEEPLPVPEPEPVPAPEPEPERLPEPVPVQKPEPVAEPVPTPEPASEQVPTPAILPVPMPEPNRVPEPVDAPEPADHAAAEGRQSGPRPGLVPPGEDPGELSTTLLALQDRARHAFVLAEAAERRIEELEDVDARAEQAAATLSEERSRFEDERRQGAEREEDLQREVSAALDRIGELEQSLAEVGAAAELARTATEKLAALSSIVEAHRGV